MNTSNYINKPNNQKVTGTTVKSLSKCSRSVNKTVVGDRNDLGLSTNK